MNYGTRKIKSGTYIYRGYRIAKPKKGFLNQSWYIDAPFFLYRRYDTLKEAKQKIDLHLDK